MNKGITYYFVFIILSLEEQDERKPDHDQNFDAWGRRRNPETCAYENVEKPPLFFRGYTGHSLPRKLFGEHYDEFNLINMNGRCYDPLLDRFLSPDNYVQMPDFTQNFNRYTYCLNNPTKYTDPTGELWNFVPWLITTGMQAGWTYLFAKPGLDHAKSQGYNANDWQFWGYGAASWGINVGAMMIGGSIATSGIAFANTASVMASSFTSSVGMHILTRGQTDVIISIGAATYNLSSGELEYLGNPENSTLENIGYGLGALATYQDIMSLGEQLNVTLATEKDLSENWHSHSLLDGEDVHIDVYGTESNDLKTLLPGGGDNRANIIDDDYLTVDLNVNKRVIQKISSRIAPKDGLTTLERATQLKPPPPSKGILFKTLTYQVPLNSCTSYTSRALWLSGVPNIPLAHPHFLHYQMVLRNAGLRPSLYSYYLSK